RAVDRLCDRAVEAAERGVTILVLSDREVSATHTSIPMLLAVSAVHHQLIRTGIRLQCSIIADTGEAREDHHYACLLGYGASCVHPWLAYESVAEIAECNPLGPERSITVK